MQTTYTSSSSKINFPMKKLKELELLRHLCSHFLFQFLTVKLVEKSLRSLAKILNQWKRRKSYLQQQKIFKNLPNQAQGTISTNMFLMAYDHLCKFFCLNFSRRSTRLEGKSKLNYSEPNEEENLDLLKKLIKTDSTLGPN